MGAHIFAIVLQFTGNFNDYDYVKQWLTDKCVPVVREVTFENVEELTEEGMPFLIYFRDPGKQGEDKVFSDLVRFIFCFFNVLC